MKTIIIKTGMCILLFVSVCVLGFSGGTQEQGFDRLDCQENLTRSLAVETAKLKTTDNQLLIEFEPPREVPTRPANPEALPETDPLHWYDIEYAGYNTDKLKMPDRPECGAYGAFVVLLQGGHHPYLTAYVNGFNRIAESYNMRVKIYNANWDLDQQAQQTEQAINDKPDMVVLLAVDQAGSLPLLRKLWQAGIPVVASNLAVSEEGMKYCLTYVGPEDWEYYRKLARYMADKAGKKGGYAVVQSIPGTSCFYSRFWSVDTELSSYAPEMKLLAADTSNCETEPTFQLISTWLVKYGKDLKAIVLPDVGPTLSGCLEAARKAGRFDLVIMTGGHSKLGQDAVKSGEFPNLTLTIQSPESSGACTLQLAADWMNGEDLLNIYAIKQGFITRDNVEEFYPAQH